MQSTKPNIVLVMEKPNIAREIAPLLANRWPDQRIFIIFTLHQGLFEFQYPRGLSFSSLPYAKDPRWKQCNPPAHGFSHFAELCAGKVTRINVEPDTLLNDSNEIWFACDPDYIGVIAYNLILSKVVSPEFAAVERPALMLTSLDGESVQKALDNPSSTESPFFKACLNAGEAKRFFDFNFNINSMVIFGECLRRVGVKTDYFYMSKYGLQLLYALKDANPLPEFKLQAMMAKWIGTGHYPPSELGSPMSRQDIIKGLINADLLKVENEEISITRKGISFLGELHPDCLDLDIPARIGHWQAGWPHNKNKMIRYLNTFFGKQLRFMRH